MTCGNRECTCGNADGYAENTLDALLRIETLLEKLVERESANQPQSPARCTGEWSTPVDLVHGTPQATGRCGICQRTVETFHTPLGTYIAAHPYILKMENP
jgi:hypothetical protein